MPTLRMPPDLVVRSAGIWNSRAPFDQFLLQHKQINRTYSLAVLAALKVERDLEGSQAASVRSYFNPRTGRQRRSNARELAAWKGYRKALGRDRATADFRSPSVMDITTDIEHVVSAVRRATLVSFVALFESYIQCWTLNYLLDTLEEGILWTNEERYLATKLSPVHSAEPDPSAAFILRCLPTLQTLLRKISPFFHDRRTGAPLGGPDPLDFNAFAAVRFWIDLRNIVVHRNGWVSTSFAKKHSHIWALLFSESKHIPVLSAGKPIFLYHDVVNCAALNLYRAALALSDSLEARSKGRRGHPWAPSLRPDPEPENEAPPPPRDLLVEGDHDLSFRWVTDAAFRGDFIRSNLS